MRAPWTPAVVNRMSSRSDGTADSVEDREDHFTYWNHDRRFVNSLLRMSRWPENGHLGKKASYCHSCFVTAFREISRTNLRPGEWVMRCSFALPWSIHDCVSFCLGVRFSFQSGKMRHPQSVLRFRFHATTHFTFALWFRRHAQLVL